MRLGFSAFLTCIVVMSIFGVTPAAAQSGMPILSVVGQIAHPDDGEVMRDYDFARLENLSVVNVFTRTPWTEGEAMFTGVLVRDVLHDAGADGTEVRAIALNDYTTTIPITDFQMYPVILAYARDNRRLTVRDRGPLWVIYPWSQYDELRNELYYSRSVWQLRTIDVR